MEPVAYRNRFTKFMEEFLAHSDDTYDDQTVNGDYASGEHWELVRKLKNLKKNHLQNIATLKAEYKQQVSALKSAEMCRNNSIQTYEPGEVQI